MEGTSSGAYQGLAVLIKANRICSGPWKTTTVWDRPRTDLADYWSQFLWDHTGMPNKEEVSGDKGSTVCLQWLRPKYQSLSLRARPLVWWPSQNSLSWIVHKLRKSFQDKSGEIHKYLFLGNVFSSFCLFHRTGFGPYQLFLRTMWLRILCLG